MLALAKVKETMLYDLGSDGRIVITAAQSSVRVASVWTLTRNALRMPKNAHKAGVTDRVKFLQQDLSRLTLAKQR